MYPYPHPDEIKAFADTPPDYSSFIRCIKAVRERRHLGLKEAKDAVDAWLADPNRYWFAVCANCDRVLEEHAKNFKCLFDNSLYEPRLLVRDLR